MINKPIRLFLVDDHTLVRDTLADRLTCESGFAVVGVAPDAVDIIKSIRNLELDIVLMDIDMPGVCCFDATQQIMMLRPDINIVFLSAFCHDHYIDMALRVKAKGYLTKSEPFSMLVKALRRVASGRTYFSPDVQARVVAGTKGVRLGKTQNTSRVSILSRRETEVLRYIAKGRSKKEIAEIMHVSVKTVDAHTQRLMNKLEIHNRVQLARFAIREKISQA